MALNLSYHGKTKEMCEWVLAKFANLEYYKDNQSVQDWVADSKAFLTALEEDIEFNEALESKFGHS